MISLKLFAFRDVWGPHNRLCGSIECASGGRFADYAVRLEGPGGCPFAEGVLKRHPRWSEPLEGLIARCIDAALAGTTLEPWFDYRHLSMTAFLHGTYLLEDFGCSHRVTAALRDADRPGLFDTPTPPNPWDVTRLACALQAWQSLATPPMPEPVQVPMYAHRGLRYCRSCDLPHHARWLFDRLAFGAPRPSVPDVADAVWPADIQRFLGETVEGTDAGSRR